MSANTIPIFPGQGRATDNEEVEFLMENIGIGIGLIVCEPKGRAVGLAHVLLPSSAGYEASAGKNPYTFADIALSSLLRSIRALSKIYAGEGWGACFAGLKVYLVGGSEIGLSHQAASKLDLNLAPKIKQVLLLALKREGLKLTAEYPGKGTQLTALVQVFTGKIVIKQVDQPDAKL